LRMSVVMVSMRLQTKRAAETASSPEESPSS
jgi:hypothetical protein